MNFVDWILRLRTRNTPTGDLARDLMSDKNFPNSSDKEKILNYLYSHNACADAIKAFRNAWSSYQTYLKNH